MLLKLENHAAYASFIIPHMKYDLQQHIQEIYNICIGK